MKWLEIIEIRSASADPETLQSILKDLVKSEKNQKIRSYCRLNINSDFSIHLHHDSETILTGGSPLGLQLASSLKEFGLVNHNIWIEISLEGIKK